MIETPSAAFSQSSRDRRSPLTNSTFLLASKSLSAFLRRSSRLEDRMKQRRLVKPYSKSFSTTFEPIKPLDPVTRMRSPANAIDLGITSRTGAYDNDRVSVLLRHTRIPCSLLILQLRPMVGQPRRESV